MSTYSSLKLTSGFPDGSVVKNQLPVQEMRVQSLGQEDPLEEEMATHSSIFAWKIHGQKSLAGYSLRGHKESDKTEQPSTHTSL